MLDPLKKMNGTAADYLENLHDRAIDSLEHGNLPAGQYLSCICGMWAETFHVPESINLFKGQRNELINWYGVGYDASKVGRLKS